MSAVTSPLDPKLRLELPDPLIPWALSPETFAKMACPTKETTYKVAQLFPTDPEWNFVWHHFHHQKPTKYSLGKVLVVHDRHQQQAFEQHLSAQERGAAKFPPNWQEEPRAAQRAQVIQLWQKSVSLFSPFESMESDGRRRSWQATKVLPLFHGTKKEICHSICESGHTFFGKISLSQIAGAPHSTDDGYFGSGIYFTNSARYAADIYSQGHLLISWVSMREPFPFVGDPTQEDMSKLRGHGHYKDYNAHYIPVTSLDPTDPNCPEYHPTQEGQLPTYDEYVVFHPTQTLPRFWIHLIVDAIFLKTISAQPQHVEDLIPHLMTLLQNPHVDADRRLRRYLNEKLEFLLKQTPDEYLDELELDTLFQDLQTLIDATGKVNRAAAKALMAAKSSVPDLAFGALKWQQYFGVQVTEPLLPADIETILAGPCPLFLGKKVAETHFLTLIPEGMTLERLEALTLNPRQGNKIRFRDKDNKWVNMTLEQHGKTSFGRAHWALIANDVILGSRSKSWKDQQALAATFKGQGYELLSGVEIATCLLVEYVQTGRRFYTNDPWTYTRCVEEVLVDSSHQWPLIIGGFSHNGIGIGCTGADATDCNVDGRNSVGVGVARRFF